MSRQGVLVVGRALHPPWNEGTRVIGHAIAQAAAELAPTRTVSLTRPEFLPAADAPDGVAHVAARAAYGAVGDYVDLPAVARRALAEARACDAGVAHIVSLPLTLAPILRRAGLRVVVHVTLTQHVYLSRVERARAWAGGRAFDRWVDAYAPAAAPLADDLVRGGLDHRRVHVVAPPTDTARFRRRDRAEARAALGFDPDAFTVVYVGTVSPARFPADDVAAALARAGREVPGIALEAFAPVRTHGYNVEWAQENVGRAVAEAGIRARMRLEDLDEERKALVYSAADVVLLPFTAPVAVEPPLTLLEALACGAAVCVAPHANRSGIVEDGRNGRVYAGIDGLAERLVELARAGRDGRALLGDAGRVDVVERFGPEATRRSLEQIWKAVGAR